MKLQHDIKKIVALAAATLTCGVVMAAPLSAFAAQAPAAPDTVTAQTIDQENRALYLDRNRLNIEIGRYESYSTAQIEVEYADDWYDYITWTSSNGSVATVDSYGNVTAWAPGTATITARTNSGDYGYCTVTVTKEQSSTPTKQQKSRLNTSYLSMNIEYNNTNPRGQLYLINGSSYDYVYQWYSSNPGVATVDGNGNVTAISEGYATIYANTYSNGTLSCAVTVNNNIGRITLDTSRVYLPSIGGQQQLVTTISVANPASVGVTWTSSNPAVAIVDAKGIVTSTGDGEATITATTSMGRSATCTVYGGATATRKKQQADSCFGLGELFMDFFD